MSRADDPRVTSTHGHAPDADDGAPGPIDPSTGMHTSYWVLTEEERKKGFVRPVRATYKHVGIRPIHPTRPLTNDERSRFDDCGYVVFETYPDGSALLGRFWTAQQLQSGCGGITTMGNAIAETYARQPDFYGATMCCNCEKHYPVGAGGEFVWVVDGKETDERVGT